jgi:HPt (histidine-containing phosphotransfer) domain-containing protein
MNLVLLECHDATIVLDVLAGMHAQSERLSTRYTPTFVLTAASLPESLPSIVDGVLESPIDCELLMTTYLKFLSASLREIERPHEARGCCEIDAAIDRLGGDVQLYKDLVARFLDDTAGTRRQLETAREHRDPPLLHRAAHSLKGLAASVGAVAVADVLGELEALGRAEDFGNVPSVWQRFQSEMATAATKLAHYRSADHSPLPRLA